MRIGGVRIVVSVALTGLVVGGGWLLDVVGTLDFLRWLWSVLLVLAGVLVVILVGLDKGTAVIAPWLLIWGVLSVLVEAGLMGEVVVLPLLVVAAAALLLASPFLPLPRPPWLFG